MAISKTAPIGLALEHVLGVVVVDRAVPDEMGLRDPDRGVVFAQHPPVMSTF